MARWPWVDVLTAGLMLDEVERVDGLRQRAGALEAAELMALAFHEPAKLGDVGRELDRERQGETAVRVTPEQAVAQAGAVLDLVAFAERVERRRRRKQRH